MPPAADPIFRWRHTLRTTWSTPWQGLDLTAAWRYFSAMKLDALSPKPNLIGAPAHGRERRHLQHGRGNQGIQLLGSERRGQVDGQDDLPRWRQQRIRQGSADHRRIQLAGTLRATATPSRRCTTRWADSCSPSSPCSSKRRAFLDDETAGFKPAVFLRDSFAQPLAPLLARPPVRPAICKKNPERTRGRGLTTKPEIFYRTPTVRRRSSAPRADSADGHQRWCWRRWAIPRRSLWRSWSW